MKHLPGNKYKYIYIIGIVLLLVSVCLGVLMGSAEIGIKGILSAFLDGDRDSVEGRILWYVRLPRLAASILCGSALAVSGVILQCSLANRLASPSIIGVNSGAGLAVTICSALGIMGGWQMSLSAFAGAFLTVLLISVSAKKWGASKGTVILMGVAINALLGAFSDTIVTLVPQISIMSNDFKIGDFSSVTYGKLIPVSIIILLTMGLVFTFSNELDLLTLGDEHALGLGLNAGLMRVVFLIMAALLAGATVSIAGLLSFVGLIIPNAIRRMGIFSSKHLLPLCALFGGGFVSLCDTLARVIFAPYELPVGIIMAFIGSPFFIYMILKVKGGHRDHA